MIMLNEKLNYCIFLPLIVFILCSKFGIQTDSKLKTYCKCQSNEWDNQNQSKKRSFKHFNKFNMLQWNTEDQR